MEREFPTVGCLKDLVLKIEAKVLSDVDLAIELYPALLRHSREKLKKLAWCLDCFTSSKRAGCSRKTIADLQEAAREQGLNSAQIVDQQLVPILKQLQHSLSNAKTIELEGKQIKFFRQADETLHELASCTLRADHILPQPKGLNAKEKDVSASI